MTLDLQTVLALLTVAAAFLFLARGTVRTARRLYGAGGASCGGCGGGCGTGAESERKTSHPVEMVRLPPEDRDQTIWTGERRTAKNAKNAKGRE